MDSFSLLVPPRVAFGCTFGDLGAHLVLLWGLWGLLWEVFGISFRGLLGPLGQSGSLGGSWGRFLMLLGTKIHKKSIFGPP